MLTLEVYGKAHALARERGIILADTKLEFGRRPDRHDVLADEVLTPDSLQVLAGRRLAAGARPGVVRQADRPGLAAVRRRPAGTDVRRARRRRCPDEVVERTRARYVEAYELLTGEPW